MKYIQTDLTHVDMTLLIEEAYVVNFEEKYSSSQVEFLSRNYPNFLDKQAHLFKTVKQELQKYTLIKELADTNRLKIFSAILYQYEKHDFQKFSKQDFIRNSIKDLAYDLYAGDLEQADNVEEEIDTIYNNETIQFDALLSFVMQLEESDEFRFKILRYFTSIDSVYAQFMDIMRMISPLYSEFRNWTLDTYPELFSKDPDHSGLYKWVDLDSFSESDDNVIYYDFSVINAKGLAAKIGVSDDKNTFVLYGVFFSKEIRSDYESVDIEKVKYYFLALGDEKRFRIFEHLITKEHYLKELAELLELTSPTVSHHMEILTRTGIVKLREKGKKIYYSINSDAVNVLAHFFTQLEESLRNQYEDTSS